MPQKISEEKKPINIFGWSCPDEVAYDVSASIHSSVLQGQFVFAYRGASDIRQLVVSQLGPDDYMIGLMTSGWSMLLPHAPKKFLLEDLVTELKSKKMYSEVTENFEKTIKKL